MSEADKFSSIIKEKGLGFLYGVEKRDNESEEDYKDRLKVVGERLDWWLDKPK